MALVLGVIKASSLSGSRFNVFGSTSQKTSLAPNTEKEEELDIQLMGVDMTSSPGSIPAAIPASVSPEVALDTASAYVVSQ